MQAVYNGGDDQEEEKIAECYRPPYPPQYHYHCYINNKCRPIVG